MEVFYTIFGLIIIGLVVFTIVMNFKYLKHATVTEKTLCIIAWSLMLLSWVGLALGN